MKKIKINLNNVTDQEIKDVITEIRSGQVIVYPTDTVYGLGGNALDRDVVDRIYRIKKRDKGKAMIILVGSYCLLKEFCYVSKKQDKYLREIWKDDTMKPTTVVLKSRGILPAELVGKENSVAVRIPRVEWLRKMIKRSKAPLISTSLNISGQEPLGDVDLIEEYFQRELPDVVIDAGIPRSKASSRLIDLRDINNIKVLRK